MSGAVELIALLPELFIVVTALILLLYGAVRGNQVTPALVLFSSLVLCVAAYFLLRQPGGAVLVLNELFFSNELVVFTKLLIVIGALLSLWIALPWLKQPATQRFEYPILLLLATVGLLLLVSANHLLSLYMALELASLSLYVMAAFDRDRARSSEAGLKYFVLGALASGMMLFGASLVYGFSGTAAFDPLAKLLSAYVDQPVAPGLLVGMVLLLVGFCFKISAVPFHMWTPDVYEGAPTPVVAFFAVAPKIAALILLVRVLTGPFGLLIDQWQPIIIFVSMASMVVGALGGLKQTNIKRLMAYSSIGHVGYALMGVAAGTQSGVQAVLIYLSLYLFMSVGVFIVIWLMQREGRPIEAIESLGGLSQTAPRLAFALLVLLFSMTGIPPLAGFFGKLYVFKAALEQEMIALVLVGLLSSVIAAFYYLRIVKVMYFDEPQPAFDQGLLSVLPRAGLCICLLVTTAFFLMPTPLVQWAKQAAMSAIGA